MSAPRRRGRARNEAALVFGVSEHRVRDAMELLRRDEALAKEVTAGHTKLSRALAQVKRAEQLRLIASTPPPSGTYRTLVVDPPWKFRDGGIRGAAEDEYVCMPLEEVEKLPVASLAAPKAHLYLWCPSVLLDQGLRLLAAWGFELVTTVIWDKRRLSLGHYLRNQHELCLFGVKGKLPPKTTDVGTVITGKMTTHSAKPDEFYELVTRASHEPYMELFARRHRHGWKCWGAEVSGPSSARHPQEGGAHQGPSEGKP